MKDGIQTRQTSFERSMLVIKKSKTRKTILILVVFTQNASRESPLNRQMKVSSDDMKQLFCFASSNEKLQNENCFVYLTTTAATRALNLANVLVTFWIIYEVGAETALVISSFEHFLQPKALVEERKKSYAMFFIPRWHHKSFLFQSFLVIYEANSWIRWSFIVHEPRLAILLSVFWTLLNYFSLLSKIFL